MTDDQSELIKKALKIAENTKSSKNVDAAHLKKQEIIENINKINISEPHETVHKNNDFSKTKSTGKSMISSDSEIDSIEIAPQKKIEKKRIQPIEKSNKVIELNI